MSFPLQRVVYLFTIITPDAEKTDVVFVQNATTAINAVIQSVIKTFQPGDSILMTNITYGEHEIVTLLFGTNWCAVSPIAVH